MNEPTGSSLPEGRRCPLGVEPADVAAWAVDDEAHPMIDLAEHVPTCGACRDVVSTVMPSAALGLALRASTPSAPGGVEQRALGRIRMEATALLLVRTFFGAATRVVQAVPSYVRPRLPHDEPGDHHRRNDR